MTIVGMEREILEMVDRVEIVGRVEKLLRSGSGM